MSDEDRYDPTAYDGLLESWEQAKAEIQGLRKALNAKISALSPKRGDVILIEMGTLGEWLTYQDSVEITRIAGELLAKHSVPCPVFVLQGGMTVKASDAPPAEVEE